MTQPVAALMWLPVLACSPAVPLMSAPEVGSASGDTGDTPALQNRLANPGFELGESWWGPADCVSHSWATTGDRILDSTATFTAREGAHALKVWGLCTGALPEDSEHGLTLTDITPGDTHAFSVHALTHADDAISGGSQLVAFLRFTDADGGVIAEHASDPVDEETARGEWTALAISAEAPPGATGGALGIRFSQADGSATGAAYLDAASWTSTGTGAVDGERLLVWHDEFSGATIDETKWTHELVAPLTYNNELQAHTDRPDNSRVEDGQLVITARSDGDGYTSARLITTRKGDWLHGRIEGMVQVPQGAGTRSALSMLPTDWAYGGWPDSGEIDIMEHVGCDAGTMHGTVHTGAYNHLLGTQQGGSVVADAGSFHLYAIDWSAERIVFTLDGTEYFRFENDFAGDPATWPFDQVLHLVVSLAVGGDWGGYCGVDRGAFPQEYRVDWIRVYQ